MLLCKAILYTALHDNSVDDVLCYVSSLVVTLTWNMYLNGVCLHLFSPQTIQKQLRCCDPTSFHRSTSSWQVIQEFPNSALVLRPIGWKENRLLIDKDGKWRKIFLPGWKEYPLLVGKEGRCQMTLSHGYLLQLNIRHRLKFSVMKWNSVKCSLFKIQQEKLFNDRFKKFKETKFNSSLC